MVECALGYVTHRLSRLTVLIVAIAVGVLIGSRAGAQVPPSSACPTQPLDDARHGVRYLPCQLTKVPVLQIDASDWHFPAMALDAGMSGRVRVAFLVDTAGRYVPGSMRALSSSHALFSNATKIGLSRARFTPGRREGTAVSVELIYDVVFALPAGVELRELRDVPEIVTLAAPSSDSIPVLEVRPDAEDPTLGPPPTPALRDSLAHEAIRTAARALGWVEGTARVTSTPPPLLICVQGDKDVFESTGDRALASTMTRPHVRVMTLRGCPPTRDQMVAVPAELQPHYPPDSVPFIEPHRLQVARVALRRGGGPQIDLVDTYQLGEEEYRCVRVPRASSIFALRCVLLRSILH